jgi:fused signal recognition particle receptor
MFDGLKDKLGSFRSDVEETAEEKAESDADGEPPADAEATPEGDATAAPADAPAPEEPAEAAPDEADTAEAPDAETPAGEAPDDADGDPNTGLGRKLKSAAKGRVVIEAEDLEDPLWELEMALLDADVEMSVAEAILDRVEENLVGETKTFTQSTGSVVEDALRDALVDVISVGQFDFDERVQAADKPVVIVFTGVNGVGKTTTIAKLSRYFEQRGLSSVLANGDTYRAGANEQIGQHAEALDKRLISHEQGGDPTAVIYDAVEYAEANDVDVVLGDTAGRLHTDEGLMDQLAKIHRVVGPDMTLFVDEAVAGQDAVQRASEFDAAAEIDGAVLTKADADPHGGAAISIAHVTGKPILFLGTGQEYDDLVRFDPDDLVDRLLGE